MKMKNVFRYITDRPLWVNILTAIVLAIVLFALFVLSLKLLTHHGRSRTVPQVAGKSFEQAEQILDKEGFEIIIQDSVYVDSLPPRSVIKQVPESDAVVKVNRTVYLTINRSVPPLVEMPNLIGYSLRNAEMTLLNVGLVIGDTVYKPDFAKNSILEQLYKDERIPPGVKIPMGSEISLVIGGGVGEKVFNVPNLVGLTYAEAKASLDAHGVNILIIPGNSPVTDSLASFIVWQNPPRYNEEGQPLRIRSGQIISIKLADTMPVKDTSTLEKQDQL